MDIHGCEEKGRVREEKKRTEEVCAYTEHSLSWCSGCSVPGQVQQVLCMDTHTKTPGWMLQGTCPSLPLCLSPQPPASGGEEAFKWTRTGRKAGPHGGAGTFPSSSPTTAPYPCQDQPLICLSLQSFLDVTWCETQVAPAELEFLLVDLWVQAGDGG